MWNTWKNQRASPIEFSQWKKLSIFCHSLPNSLDSPVFHLKLKFDTRSCYVFFFVFVVLIWNCSSLMFTLHWTTTFSTDAVCVCVRAASMCTQIEERWTSNAGIHFWHNSCGNYTYADADTHRRSHTHSRTICCGTSMYVRYIFHTCIHADDDKTRNNTYNFCSDRPIWSWSYPSAFKYYLDFSIVHNFTISLNLLQRTSVFKFKVNCWIAFSKLSKIWVFFQ